MRKELLQIADTLPKSPGCYIFKGMDHSVLYVGKSKNLRSRVRQYFFKNNYYKVKSLVKLIKQIEYIPADTELDALFLEYTLIKQYQPPFNSQMKRNISPVYLCIPIRENKPGIFITHALIPDTLCFGYFYSSRAAEEVLLLLNQVWRTPLCGRQDYNNPSPRPCLHYQIGQCLGPCLETDDDRAYRQIIHELCKFLQSKNKRMLIQIKNEMKRAAEHLAFEQAARLRDRYRRLSALRKRMQGLNINFSFEGKRICILAKGYHENLFALFYMENGKILMGIRFAGPNEWPGIKRDLFIRRLLNREWDAHVQYPAPAAILEIRIKKLLIEIGNTREASALARKLDKAVHTFTSAG